MKHFLLCSFICSICVFFSFKVAAQKDSVPARIIPKVRITVKDLADGNTMDSVLVTIGLKKGYTNKDGYLELDELNKESQLTASKNGYLLFTRKVKPEVIIRLTKKETSSIAQYSNGLFSRPIEYFSGSATVVSGDDLRKINPINFLEALKYYAPSLLVNRNNNYGDDPNTPSSINIRGAYNLPASATIAKASGTSTGLQLSPSSGDFIASNISNPNQPVILLNGIQVSLQTVLDIDISQINKVTILKDAAATTEYGVRGGNGVLLVQTRQPVKGVMNVSYSGQVQIANADLSSYHLLDAVAKLQLEQKAGLFSGNPGLYQSRLYHVNKGINTDWMTVPTKTAVSTRHDLFLNGGDDNLSYGLDFSYNGLQGVMKGSQRQNLNFSGYISTRIKNAVFSNYLYFTKVKANNSPYGSFADYVRQNPYWNPADSVTGATVKVLEEYPYQGSTVRTYNPAYNATLSTLDQRASGRISNLTSINWNIGYGFKLDARFAISTQSDLTDVFLPPGHTIYAAYSPENFFKRGQYDQTSSEFSSLEAGTNLHYTKRAGLHMFYASSGVSAMKTNSKSTGVQVIGFTSDKLSDLSFGASYSNSRPATGKIETRLASAYGNLTYSYDNRYQLEGTASGDESSQFGKNSGAATYWSAGASWNLHQERFFHSNKIISELRLRGSIGTAGNQFFQSYLANTYYNYYTDRQYVIAGSTPGTRGIGLGAFLTGYGNDNVKAPETQKQNIGLEAVLLQNRLTIKGDVYRNQTKNLLVPVVSPASTGFLSFNYYDNLGAVQSKGLEFDMVYHVIQNQKKGITWSIQLNGIHNTDRITATSAYLDSLNVTNDLIKSDQQTRPQPRYVVGQSLTGIWAVRSLGIDPATGQEKFLKADGSQTTVWSAADKVLAGDVAPKLQGSFGTSLAIKNISAGIYFNYSLGASYYNQTLADRLENAEINYNVDQRATADRWQHPGDVALYKAISVNGMLTSPTYVTTRFVEKANLLNCSAISLGYSLPETVAAKIGAKSAKVGLVANNAFRTNSIDTERGIYYPFQKAYTFSITTNF